MTLTEITPCPCCGAEATLTIHMSHDTQRITCGACGYSVALEDNEEDQ